jgi:DNA repair protein RadC
LGPLLQGKLVEHFGVLSLDTRHRVIAWDVISVGTIDASLVHPREVFLTAILHHAAALVVCHYVACHIPDFRCPFNDK